MSELVRPRGADTVSLTPRGRVLVPAALAETWLDGASAVAAVVEPGRIVLEPDSDGYTVTSKSGGSRVVTLRKPTQVAGVDCEALDGSVSLEYEVVDDALEIDCSPVAEGARALVRDGGSERLVPGETVAQLTYRPSVGTARATAPLAAAWFDGVSSVTFDVDRGQVRLTPATYGYSVTDLPGGAVQVWLRRSLEDAGVDCEALDGSVSLEYEVVDEETLEIDCSALVDPELVADEGLPPNHAAGLIGFRRDLLVAIGLLDGEPGPRGQTIKDCLDEWYGEDINHGRLYPNLDQLAADGYVHKDVGAPDARSNAYRLTDRGWAILAGQQKLLEGLEALEGSVADGRAIADGAGGDRS